MNKFKVGDKIKVKENFWKIESNIYDWSGMKKLAGRTLEVKSVYSDGNVHTKQDDSSDDTSWYWDKNWVELCNPIITPITWETLKWKDVVIDEDGKERMVLLIANDLVFISNYTNFDTHSVTRHKKELQNLGYTIKQATPPVEKLELTPGQVVEKFVANVLNIKIKK